MGTSIDLVHEVMCDALIIYCMSAAWQETSASCKWLVMLIAAWVSRMTGERGFYPFATYSQLFQQYAYWQQVSPHCHSRLTLLALKRCAKRADTSTCMLDTSSSVHKRHAYSFRLRISAQLNYSQKNPCFPFSQCNRARTSQLW